MNRPHASLAAILLCIAGATVRAGAAQATAVEAPAHEAAVQRAFEVLSDGGEPAAHRAEALESLSRQPLERLRAFLAGVAGASPSVSRAGAAIAVLARAGRADDLALMARFHSDETADAFEDGVVAILSRDRGGLLVLDAVRDAGATGLRASCVRSVARLPAADSARWLARCVQRAGDVRPEAVARLGRMALEVPVPLPEEARHAVRALLDGADRPALQPAIIAAGRLHDTAAVPALIACLGDASVGVRADAAWALERISGLHFDRNAELWRDWFAREAQWWREDGEQAAAALQAGDRAARTQTLLAIGSRRAWRDQLASLAAVALHDEDPGIAVLAAQVLATLDSKAGVPPLLQALGRGEDEVVKAACSALRSITGKDLPPEPASWRAAIGG